MNVEQLRQELRRRCERNPRYSIRAFARALEIHPSTLAAILAEKRPLTRKTAIRLASRLAKDLKPFDSVNALEIGDRSSQSDMDGRGSQTDVTVDPANQDCLGKVPTPDKEPHTP